jgi:hypothetical protein
MRAQGYSPEDFDNEIEVWPENYATFLIFQRMRNQWNWVSAGMGGAVRIGLNMTALPVFTARMNLSDAEYEEMLDDLQLMESAALSAMNE